MSVADHLVHAKQAPTMADVAAARVGAPPKPLPHILVKKDAKKAKKLKDDAFRALIWKLDGGKSRATGTPLSKHGNDWSRIGEVDHVINRSLAPDRIYDPANALLLSKEENRLKKTPCPRAPEHHMFEVVGPDNRRLPQTFTWRDADGTILRTKRG
jgi:5-methylcytosine-specific restriction endonuclease McrA